MLAQIAVNDPLKDRARVFLCAKHMIYGKEICVCQDLSSRSFSVWLEASKGYAMCLVLRIESAGRNANLTTSRRLVAFETYKSTGDASENTL